MNDQHRTADPTPEVWEELDPYLYALYLDPCGEIYAPIWLDSVDSNDYQEIGRLLRDVFAALLRRFVGPT